MGLNTIPEFRLNNIIGIAALDSLVCPMQSLHGDFDILVLDPGEMVGWAGTRDDFILVGQGPWFECLSWTAYTVYIEATPYAAKRTFDQWPIRYDGAVRAKIFPDFPLSVFPTNLKVARKWYSLPRGHGIGRHAKDALTHLVSVLVRESA